MRCSQLFHGKQWVKRRENEPWASAECSGPQHDITKPKTNFAATYKWSMTQMKVPDWLFVAIPRGAKPHGSKSFNPFTELGSMWHCAESKVCLRRSRRTLRVKKIMTCIKIYSTISTYKVPEVTTVITGFAWQRMVYKARMNPGHAAESAQGLV